ncbi:hypothetical protein RR46_00317 [Papilio xuthus]|uniref:Uncharacterized protein n=1 Tax=Papilio xuthus TaxID=66420 RepID=A0A0N1PFX1_PAPXU|nr:hypothetical protein RR46_00317 [Papilio xuthus]
MKMKNPFRLLSLGSRRRAGGRAAALRRAPSDSDCSGETASLSADSAERAPRAPPQPARQTKSRGLLIIMFHFNKTTEVVDVVASGRSWKV